MLESFKSVISSKRNEEPVVLSASVLKKFYNHYDYKKISTNYYLYAFNKDIIKTIKQNKAIFDVTYNNDRLELFIQAKDSSRLPLLTMIGFFFEQYDPTKNCVFTTNEKNIINFFEFGLAKFREANVNLFMNLYNESAKKIVKLMLGKDTIDEDLFNKLASDLNSLSSISWKEYKDNITKQYEQELEASHIEEVTSMDLPADWFNFFSDQEIAKDVYAASAADGLVLSLNNLGKVDIEYISQITGLSCKDVIHDLRGSIYQNPEEWNECFYKGWETADEYLSGRVLDKLKVAHQANEKYKGYFIQNVEALEKVKPAYISENDIYITLGSPWVPPYIIDQFIFFLFGDLYKRLQDYSVDKEGVKYDSKSGMWEVPRGWKNTYSFSNTVAYGSRSFNGLNLLEKALNSQIPSAYDSVKSGAKTKRIFNKEETLLARQKQLDIINEFKKWVWQDQDRKLLLMGIYYDKYCQNIIRKYDGSFLELNEINSDINLFDYQKDAVARILFSPNVLLSHDVGAGKTYVMITAGMEKKRLGLSSKNLYVVPNNLVGQWHDIFKSLYPNSNVLCIEPKSFTPDKRNKVLAKLRDGDFDGVIIAYSCFTLIPISKSFYIKQIEEQIDTIKERIKVMKRNSAEGVKKIEKLMKDKDKFNWLLTQQDSNIYFDELGITNLYVDEAHNFKNLPIETQSSYVLGVASEGSKKCTDLLNKVRIIQSKNNGGGVVFATGTPITNSITDIFAMQKYLQEAELSFLNLASFDSWIGMFAESKLEFEIDVDTNSYRMVTRYSKFHNMPELGTLLSNITDFHQIDKALLLPKMKGYTDVVVNKTPDFKNYLQLICVRAENVRKRRVSRKDDNMLKITTDGRKAALDMRLVNPSLPEKYDSKVYFCAENVYKIYRNTQESKSTQLVFCDSSTPKKEFNVYDALKDLLVKFGIPEDEIAYIHDVTTDKERTALFKKVQKGEMRILIGSTAKLGLGVNVQDKLIALHHLDIPWRPADMIQREGRILRKGNENDEIQIFRYITDGSFDAYSWQILETKQRMIRGILSGTMPKRMCEELDDVVLNYAEIKALAVGNPLLKERVELVNELSRVSTLNKKHQENRHGLEVELLAIPNKIKKQKQIIENCMLDKQFYDENKVKYSNEERAELRQTIFKGMFENTENPFKVKVCDYQGFDVLVPNSLTFNKNVIYLSKNGEYMIEAGESDKGVLIRIDNFLEGFDKLILKEEQLLEKLEQRKHDIEEELQKEEDYSEQITNLQNKIKKVNKKLGVEDNE